MTSAQEVIFHFMDKSKSSIMLLLYIATVLIIVFKDTIPEHIHSQADSFLGRCFGLLLVVFITHEYGLILGVLTAISVTLLIGSRMSAVLEGFGSGGETSKIDIPKTKRWFVERALKQNPTAVEEERVITEAIQTDDTRGGYSSGGGVQNSSVSR
jgi:hypothetical protein